MEQRTKISTLFGRRIATIRRSENRRFFEFLSQSGAIIFSVMADELFDKNGMYFNTDEIE